MYNYVKIAIKVKFCRQKIYGCRFGTIHVQLKKLKKKKGMDVVFKSFCPVSNLSYISKLVERFAADQLVDYVTQNGLGEKFQSAYRASHSTETALTQVRNDILLNMDDQRSTCLVLLDLWQHLIHLIMLHC